MPFEVSWRWPRSSPSRSRRRPPPCSTTPLSPCATRRKRPRSIWPSSCRRASPTWARSRWPTSPGPSTRRSTTR
ncbi:MAG: hypothetical protein F4018_19615 [Acidobacteria bacterium]|nr:hypothetical protein [Acidobacteriota bacterium]MYK90369.1 hypothetical protein [Acidobacteriota bacterium]